MRLFKWVVFGCVFLSLPTHAEQPRTAGRTTDSPAQAPVVKKMLNLFDTLRSADSPKGRADHKKVSFTLTETEINSYLGESLRLAPRPGLDSIKIKIFPRDYVSTFTVVDFDAVERWKPGTIPLLLRPILTGKKDIWIDVSFRAARGQGTFSIEKAYFQNVRLPAILVEKIIQVVAARQPEHYDTSKPVPLPFGLQRISTSEKLVGGQN